MRNYEELKELQSLPLERKILISQTRIIEFYQKMNGNVYVSFSGGKDSTVLLHLIRTIYSDVPAVYINTGLEYPEIREFALSHNNVEEVRPKYGKIRARKYGKNPDDIFTFSEVIKIYGYPLISKEVSQAINSSRENINGAMYRSMHGTYKPEKGNGYFNYSKYLPVVNMPVKISSKCCDIMKKSAVKERERESHPYIGNLATESRRRLMKWRTYGCNIIDSDRPQSSPLSFWTEQDILEYIIRFDLPICSVYGDIKRDKRDCLYCTKLQRTGCMFCAYGAHSKKDHRFLRLKENYPKIYDYCLNGGEWVDNPDYDSGKDPGLWNPKQIWQPNKKGLGMGKVFDMLNSIYEEGFIKYK